MNIILQNFFKDIPSIVFEPIALLGWLGLLTALWLYRKERSVLYLTAALGITFMIVWRCGIQMVSSRYAEILIFPMTVAAAFFIFRLEHIRKVLPRFPEKYAKLPGICLLCIITLICVGKNLRYDRYHPIMEAGKIVKADKAPGKKIVYAFPADRLTQISYYTGLEARQLPKAKEDPREPLCREMLRAAAGYRTVYLFVTAPRSEKAVTAAEAGVKESAWTVMTEKYLNRKKKHILRVYKYSAE